MLALCRVPVNELIYSLCLADWLRFPVAVLSVSIGRERGHWVSGPAHVLVVLNMSGSNTLALSWWRCVFPSIASWVPVVHPGALHEKTGCCHRCQTLPTVWPFDGSIPGAGAFPNFGVSPIDPFRVLALELPISRVREAGGQRSNAKSVGDRDSGP
jgi:hypothetical protein